MGVEHLLPLVAALMQVVAPNRDLDFAPKLGMDVSVLIHVLVYRFMEPILLHNDWDGFREEAAMFLRSVLAWCDCTALLLLVFDGLRQQAKLANASRSTIRQAALPR